MGKKIKLSASDQKRVANILSSVEKENEAVQKEVAKKIPSHVELNSLKAKTFNEFALMPVCRRENHDYTDPLFDYTKVIPYCPFCNTKENVVKKGDRYKCNSCSKTFYPNHNSISSGTKVSATTWLKVLNCLLDNKTVKDTCNICEIGVHTYYQIRTRLFYAMKLMLEDVRLYGKIQVDTTFTRVSYKGTELTDEEYPDDSPFGEVNSKFIPREPKKRGTRNAKETQYFNQNCVVCFIDDFGHCKSEFLCIGTANFSVLKEKINPDIFLENVPSKDPFEFTNKRVNHKKRAGEKSIYISDNEMALIKYGETTGLLTEHHVYRKNGVQLKLPKGANNIQRVNNLHYKLKKFLAKSNYVSSRYLPGVLCLFDWIQITGCTEESKIYLFEIISTPGLGKPAAFFDKFFIPPNYLLNSNTPNTPLKKYPKNYLVAAYLYHQKQNKSLKIKMGEIERRTGLSVEIIRRTYKNISALGLIEDLDKSYKLKGVGNDEFEIQIPKKRYGFYCSPEMLSVFDEYLLIRYLPDEERMTKKEFIAYANEKYNLNLTERSFHNRVKSIVKWGIRPPLGRLPRNSNYVTRNGSKTNEMLPYANEALEAKRIRERNGKPESKLSICTAVEKKHGLKPMKLYKHMDYMKYW